MMNKLIVGTLFALIFSSLSVSAQTGWAVIKGNPSASTIVKGVRGVPHNNNTPGVRTGGATWHYNGKLYLYGGARADKWSYGRGMTDVWCYDTATHQWTWLLGDQLTHEAPVYGQKGIPDTSVSPGSRVGVITWQYNNKFYLYGGEYVPQVVGTPTFFNDMWVYDPTINMWAWLGDKNTQVPVYGTRGIHDTVNSPGQRGYSCSWVHNGKFYLFGGLGNDSTILRGTFTDVWEYDLSLDSWAWLKGATHTNAAISYGTLGVSSSSTEPMWSIYNTAWYKDNKVYVFATDNGGDQLVEYDHNTNNWTWIKGNMIPGYVDYGTKNVPSATNSPGSREEAIGWVDDDKLFMYGGYVFTDFKEDLWEYNISTKNWVWINGSKMNEQRSNFGTYNKTASTNWPGSKYNNMCWDLGDHVYLFGGSDYESSIVMNRVGESIWKYDKKTQYWTWVKGMHNPMSINFFMQPNVAHHMNQPLNSVKNAYWDVDDTVYTASQYSPNGKVYLWKYTAHDNMWTMVREYSSEPDYGVKGVPDPNNSPGSRSLSSCWYFNNKLYLFSGKSKYNGNDLWEYDLSTRNWTWLKGEDYPKIVESTYGTKGVYDSKNTPSTRYRATTWVYKDHLFLFAADDKRNPANDIWEYNPTTNNWRWVSGETMTPIANYGQKGVDAATNVIPAKKGSASVYYNERLYVFGGLSIGKQYNPSFITNSTNDLWEYNPKTNSWRWLAGDSVLQYEVETVFGIKGVGSVNNTPCARSGSSMAAHNGKLYIYGGLGDHSRASMSVGILDDLWEYNLSTGEWKWLTGSGEIVKPNGYYDKRDHVDTSYTPGSSQMSKLWRYDSKLYLFGTEYTANNNEIMDELHMSTNAIWTYETGDTAKPYLDINNLSQYRVMIEVFPNPAEKMLSVKSEARAERIMISDIYGKTVIDKKAVGNINNVDVSKLSSGIYIVYLHYEGGNAVGTQKFVKL